VTVREPVRDQVRASGREERGNEGKPLGVSPLGRKPARAQAWRDPML